MIVDRFEGNYAILELENSEHMKIPLSSLPKSIREGDVIRPDKENQYIIDGEATEARRLKIREKMKKLLLK